MDLIKIYLIHFQFWDNASKKREIKYGKKHHHQNNFSLSRKSNHNNKINQIISNQFEHEGSIFKYVNKNEESLTQNIAEFSWQTDKRSRKYEERSKYHYRKK